jgi:hypothetical protein
LRQRKLKANRAAAEMALYILDFYRCRSLCARIESATQPPTSVDVESPASAVSVHREMLRQNEETEHIVLDPGAEPAARVSVDAIFGRPPLPRAGIEAPDGSPPPLPPPPPSKAGGPLAAPPPPSSVPGCARRGIWLPRRAPHAPANSRMGKVSVWLEQAVDARDDGSARRQYDIATTERLAAISGANPATPSPLMTPGRTAVLRRLDRAAAAARVAGDAAGVAGVAPEVAAAALEKKSEGAGGMGSGASPQLEVPPAATPATPAAAAALSPQLQVPPAATSKSRTIRQV